MNYTILLYNDPLPSPSLLIFILFFNQIQFTHLIQIISADKIQIDTKMKLQV